MVIIPNQKTISYMNKSSIIINQPVSTPLILNISLSSRVPHRIPHSNNIFNKLKNSWGQMLKRAYQIPKGAEWTR